MPWPERPEYFRVEATVDWRPNPEGPRFDGDRDVNEKAGFPREERCHNVATTGVDSGDSRRLEGTTAWLEREDRTKT